MTHADVDSAIKISRPAEYNQDVNKFAMVRASEIDGDFIPSLRGSDISVLQTNSSLIKKFEDEFQRKVWFVEAEETTDRRSLKTSFLQQRFSRST